MRVSNDTPHEIERESARVREKERTTSSITAVIDPARDHTRIERTGNLTDSMCHR
jgi:hypothetical protein